MYIREYLPDCGTQESINLAFYIHNIMDEIECINTLLDDRKLFMLVGKSDATVILIDNGDFKDCKASVFTMDDKNEWTASKCTGTVEMMKALCPHVDIDSLIDKED